MDDTQAIPRGVTANLAKALLAEGTNPNTIKTTNLTDYAIDSALFRKAATDNIAMNALAVQAADTTCIYLVQIDSAGAVTLKKGQEELNANLAGAGNTRALHTPEPDALRCPLGHVKVKTVAVTFTSGTTDLSAAGITATYVDYFGMPKAPLTS